MFEVEKPRQFHYTPRFYDPEKEKWEALKKKYAIEQERKEAQEKTSHSESIGDEDADLEYFKQRVREIDRSDRVSSGKMTWRDMFRKREMPKFSYQPRFVDGVDTKACAEDPAPDNTSTQADKELTQKYVLNKHQIKIRRRFDISDPDYMKPISGTKIIMYCFVVFLLLTLILSF